MAEMIRDVLGLVHHAGADRTRIDFDQADDVRIFLADEIRYPVQHFSVAAKITGTRKRQMERGTGARGVTDVVNEKSQ